MDETTAQGAKLLVRFPVIALVIWEPVHMTSAIPRGQALGRFNRPIPSVIRTRPKHRAARLASDWGWPLGIAPVLSSLSLFAKWEDSVWSSAPILVYLSNYVGIYSLNTRVFVYLCKIPEKPGRLHVVR